METNKELDVKFVETLYKFRKFFTMFQTSIGSKCGVSDLNMSEIIFMKSIVDNRIQNKDNIFSIDMQEDLHISKAAISKIVSNLENKGYLNREINKLNRRKIELTLTEKGQEILKKKERFLTDFRTKIVSELGEKDVKELIRILNNLGNIISKETS